MVLCKIKYHIFLSNEYGRATLPMQIIDYHQNYFILVFGIKVSNSQKVGIFEGFSLG